MAKRILIGLDDTDAPGGRGTGFQAMLLGEMIMSNKLGEVRAISRHQLVTLSEISATSDNSAACIELITKDLAKLSSFCIQFIHNESSPEANAGLCIAPWDKISATIIDWGRNAKMKRLIMENAHEIAAHADVLLKGISGTKEGIIGALAAVGLRKSGFDGRFLWLERLRDLTGVYSAEDLMALVRADAITDPDGRTLHPDDLVEVGEWFRPVNLNHQITIIVEKNPDLSIAKWITASRELTQQHSDLSL